MAIPLAQLVTWSNQGAVTTSSAAYASIKHALTKNTSPLVGKGLDIFLQGSYANDTNIYGDSDVDVVVFYDETFHYDWSQLPPDRQ
jgi:tRNA nucleotidyltransferase (CCA-adding enzyme)